MAEVYENYTAIQMHNGSAADLTKEENLNVVTLKRSSLGELGPDEVKVRVYAFALNPADTKLNQFSPQMSLEYVPCSDAAGAIIEVGGDVKNFEVGDSVFLNTQIGSDRYGTAAEIIIAKAAHVAHRAESIKLVEAAGLPLVAVTALDAVNTLGDLAEGSTVYINGASGGVGTLAVQIAANVKKYKVFGICSGKNAEMVKGLGATDIINYKETNFVEYAEGGKIDGFIDCVGYKETWTKACEILKDGAQFVTIAGDDPVFELGLGMDEVFARSQADDNNYTFCFYNTTSDKLAKISSYVKNGLLKPMIHAVYSHTQIREAFKDLKTQRATGKIVVTFDQNGGGKQ